MIKLEGERIYLSVLEKKHCRAIFEDTEYDFEARTEQPYIGLSVEKADEWFDEIQKLQGNTNVRLGIFLKDGTVLGDVALQSLDWQNRACSLGMGIAKIENRNRGYGKEAIRLMLDYAFCHLGLERVYANTLDVNHLAQKSLEKSGFVLEGKDRQAVYFGGARHDRYNYGLLASEYRAWIAGTNRSV